ncbi:hypothetical protein PUN28_012735 [Cardiocondyla obscurior]|uniref:Uncharacterized protein n=1 Tax=Cardiocondyla obscurior TaxID=286306 RepID=A0AAW2F7K1_9HYME
MACVPFDGYNARNANAHADPPTNRERRELDVMTSSMTFQSRPQRSWSSCEMGFEALRTLKTLSGTHAKGAEDL